MAITCPADGGSVTTRPAAGGVPGVAPGYICVSGTIDNPGSGPYNVWVKVYDSTVVITPAILSSAAEAKTGTQATINGNNWCAVNVVVPFNLGAAGNALPGYQIQIVAWQLLQSTGAVASAVHQSNGCVVPAVGGATDCCPGCSGSGSSSPEDRVVRAVAGAAALNVSVPNGPSTGIHMAKLVAAGTWVVQIGRSQFQLKTDLSRNGLAIAHAGGSTGVIEADLNPFSATLPGELFGASADAVVTIA
jgi:hypothetical protein